MKHVTGITDFSASGMRMAAVSAYSAARSINNTTAAYVSDIADRYISCGPEERYSMVRGLIDLFSSADRNERLAAGNALSEIGMSCINTLVTIMRSTQDEHTMYWIARTLCALGGQRAEAELDALLESDCPSKRRCVIHNLKHYRGGNRLDLLVKSLGDPEWENRKLASSIIMAMNGDTVKKLNSFYKTANRDQRYWIIKCMAGMLGEKGIRKFERFLKKGDRETRFSAIMALAAAGDKSSIPLLAGSLSDRDWEIRAQAASYLERFGVESLTELQKTAMISKDPEARRTALTLVARIGKHEAVAFIEDLARDPGYQEPRDRLTLMDALVETVSREAIEVMIRFFRDRKWLVRQEAVHRIQGLVMLYPEKAVSVMQEYFDAEDETVCPWILKVIENCGAEFEKLYSNYHRLRNRNIRLAVIESLSSRDLQSLKPVLVDILFSALSDEWWTVRKKSSDILSLFNPANLSGFVENSRHGKSPDFRFWIREILGDSTPVFDEPFFEGEIQNEPGPVQLNEELIKSDIDLTARNITFTDRQVKKYLDDLKKNEFEEVQIMSLQSLLAMKSLDSGHLERILRALKKIRHRVSAEFRSIIKEAEDEIRTRKEFILEI